MSSRRPQTEYQRRWDRNFLTLALPGLVLFAIGGATGIGAVIIAGWLLVVVSGIRAVMIVRKYRRCRSCQQVNFPRSNAPDVCIRCGAELPVNG